ncbi:hypothetical protein ACYULU_12880 [Breznakiellaceae bacterium SP9]
MRKPRILIAVLILLSCACVCYGIDESAARSKELQRELDAIIKQSSSTAAIEYVIVKGRNGDGIIIRNDHQKNGGASGGSNNTAQWDTIAYFGAGRFQFFRTDKSTTTNDLIWGSSGRTTETKRRMIPPLLED